MEETFRISVRELVAFSYFEADILPAGDMSVMWAGTRAHRARQARLMDGEAEKPVSHTFGTSDGPVTVYGRMDAFTDGAVPRVEEIKLSGRLEDAPLPEHRAQAICYAAMVAEEEACQEVCVSVCYVDENGSTLREFVQTLCRGALMEEMLGLLHPYLAFAVRERAHRERRNASLRALPFPFERYRAGQRELAAQVYTAIARKKRLFASLPTGTGKSAAVLYPALKALGEGKTEKVVYLTARNTARQSPLNALERMGGQGLEARVTVLTAKEKLCSGPGRCHPDVCARAKGHFDRQGAAIEELLAGGFGLWTEAVIRAAADRHDICPFELALSLTELADVVLMDLNYAFDPFAQLKRLFQRRGGLTLLVDEAHHAVDRVRESLSGELDSGTLARARAAFGRAAGRTHPYYKALSKLTRELRAIPARAEEEAKGGSPERGDKAALERTLESLPAAVAGAARELLDAALSLMARPMGGGEAMAEAGVVLRQCFAFCYAAEHLDEDYAVLLSARGRERELALYCLLPAKEIARVTKAARGAVFFSATLTPLPAMKRLLGGTDEDACFSLPSPFPPERLAVVRKRVSTRYGEREKSAAEIAACIEEAVLTRPGKYIAYFPSYAYLRLVRACLREDGLPPVWAQRQEMTEDERASFMDAFEGDNAPKLGMCVLGGLFSEGIDLPGDRLIGVAVVGVGLPAPTQRLRAVQACYARHFGDGFGYACRIPAMHKVLQAGGRVMRSERDKGLVLLMDERYYLPEYEALLPPEWRLYDENIARAVKRLEECE